MAKVFVIDCDLCNGCYACQIACKDEHCGNNWMPYARSQPEWGQFWLKLEQHVRGSVGKTLEGTEHIRESSKMRVDYVPKMCMHCEDAPCIAACTSNAISKRGDGLVWIDPAKCTGQQMCVDACPYGVIYYNKDYNIAQKCTGCAHLLDRGWPITEPRCVDACYPGMIKFGEEAEFSAQIAMAEKLEPNFGDVPKSNVYYLNLPKRFISGTVYDPTNKEVVIDATVTLSGDGSGTATTDGFGDFWFEGLAVGTYSVSISGNGKSATVSDISTEKDVNLGDIPVS